MPAYSLIALPNHAQLDYNDGDAEFCEIHLDKTYYVGDNSTLHQVMFDEKNRMGIKANYKLFWNPDQCVSFIVSCEWRKTFLTLTDEFSYLLLLIHDLPQIVYIYIYSESPENVPYTNSIYPKLRAIVNQNSPDADNQLLADIETFRQDLLPVNVTNPGQRKTKLLIEEPLTTEKYAILWLEDNDETESLDVTAITKIIGRLDFFFDVEHLINTIQSFKENTNIFLVLSHSETETLVKEVIDFPNVIALYLLDREQRIAIILDSLSVKYRGKYSDLESLSTQIAHDYKRLKNTSSSLDFSVFQRESNQKTVRDLNKESSRFLWLQLLIDILIRTPCNEQGKDEMLNACRLYYKGDTAEMKKIEDFAKNYEPANAVTYYTNDSFVFRLFNQAFRTENIDLIFIFRFFLIDMYNHLQKLYSNQFLSHTSHSHDRLVVYRGQRMKMIEFGHIQHNVGRLISINSLFSTTRNPTVAVIYAPTTAEDELSVVFEIEIHLTRHATKRPFASIEGLSQFPEEEEVLLWVGSTFRIVNVHDLRITDGYYLVKMIKAEDEDDDDLNELRRELDKQYSRYENLCDLGFALIGMGDYDRAERYFQMLLEYTPKFSPSIGLILNGLGISFANRGDYLKALEFQEEALKFWTKGHPAEYHVHHIANTHVHIGAAYRHLGQDELALKFLLKAADIQSRTESSAFIYNEIAITYRDKGNNRLALEYFLKALNIDENVLKLSQYHPNLATVYNNIGEIYVNLGHYDHAARYLEHALEIRLKGTVTTHNDLATIYHNLGAVYTDRKEFQKALDMQQKALEIDARTLSADHESLALCHRNISNIQLNLGRLAEALYHAENALRIVLRSQAKGNLPMVASLQQHLGRVQYELGNTKKASKMAEKALKSISECSSEHPEITAHIYNLFSLVYEKEENTVRALEYLEKAIEQMKVWGMHSSTSDLEYYLFRLDKLKNQSSSGNNECKLSAISQKVLLDNSSMTDEFIQQLADELRKTPKTDILTRLELINLLIVACSKQMHSRSAIEYFDEANSIYSEQQSSNMVDAEQLDEKMMMTLFNMARSYHRQQQWDMCRSYLKKSLELVLKQKEEPMILPQIYYCMASTYAHQQEIDSAIVHYELAISAAKKRLPDDHPDVQLYCFQLQKYKNDVQEAYSKGYLPRKRV